MTWEMRRHRDLLWYVYCAWGWVEERLHRHA